MNYIKLFTKIKPYRLAKILNIPATTIYSWKKNGIPSWRSDQIKYALKKLEIDYSEELEEGNNER